jgi:hypothetical protein
MRSQRGRRSAQDLIGGDMASTQTDSGQVRSLLGWLWKEGKSLIALAAVLIYGGVRLALEAFYARFGLTPEEVGLDQGTILGRAALFFSTFVIAGFFLFSIAWWIVDILRRSISRLGSWQVPQRNLHLIHALLSCLIVAIVGPVLLLWRSGYLSVVWSSDLGLIITMTIAWLAIIATILYHLRVAVQDRNNPWTNLVVVVMAASIVGLSVASLASARGELLASAVEGGFSLTRLSTNSMLGLRVDLVCLLEPSGEKVQPAAGKAQPSAGKAQPSAGKVMPEHYMMLGSNDGRLILYELDTGRLWRIPGNNRIVKSADTTFTESEKWC